MFNEHTAFKLYESYRNVNMTLCAVYLFADFSFLPFSLHSTNCFILCNNEKKITSYWFGVPTTRSDTSWSDNYCKL